MTRDEFRTIVKGLKAIYADPKFIPDKDAFELWFVLFANTDYAVFQAAVQKYILTSNRIPTPADINEKIAELTALQAVNAEEAWQMVVKALRNSTYGAEEEFAKLPETVQRAIASPDNLRNMASMPSDTVHSVEKSHFFRVYRAECEQKKQNAMLPESLMVPLATQNQKLLDA